MPLPLGPTNAVTWPSFAVKLTSVSTASPARPSVPAPYENATWLNVTLWFAGENSVEPAASGSRIISCMRRAEFFAENSSAISMGHWSNGA